MTAPAFEIRPLPAADLGRIRAVDRSERITRRYLAVDGTLREDAVDWDVPNWPEEGARDFSIRGLVDEWMPILDAGGTLLGAVVDDDLVGFAILRPELSPGTAQLVALYVHAAWRRRGVAGALLDEVERRARAHGAASLYVSATPSESAVGFYRSRGFGLARPVNAELAALEPEDIQMEKALG